MLKNRVIPVLLVNGDRLVKTRKFSSPKYVGDPLNAIRIFNEKEVDELMVLDIHVSKQKQEPNYRLIEMFAGECFMPLCYGGGISNVEQARTLFSLGVEKVCLQTVVLDDFVLITELADQFGSQSIVVSIDIKRNWLGKLKVYSSARGRGLKTPWQKYLVDAVSAGAGEIVLNAVDHDGVMAGMNITLIKEASALTSVPLIAAGGVGSLVDIKSAVDAGASAVGVGAFFVFHGPHRAVLITYPRYQELEVLLGVAEKTMVNGN